MPQYRIVPLDSLILDSNNPRLPLSKCGSGEREILKYLLTDGSLIELMLAIGENGFFAGEQLLVIPMGNQFKVIEGNRRLSAVKLLNNPELVDVQQTKIERVLAETTFRPHEIPCLIFDNEEEIHKYLGFRHITGIKEWRLLEKARYLSGLRNNLYAEFTLENSSKELAKSIGSRKDYVKRILIGFNIYKIIEDEGFFNITDLNDTTFYFNYIADSLNRANICNFLGIDLNSETPTERLILSNLRKWAEWLFQRNDQGKTRLIGDSYDLTSLNAVLGNEEAKVAFMDSGYSLERARELTDVLDSQFVSFVKKASELLEQADRLVSKVKIFNSTTQEELRNIRVLSTKIVRTIQEREDEIIL